MTDTPDKALEPTWQVQVKHGVWDPVYAPTIHFLDSGAVLFTEGPADNPGRVAIAYAPHAWLTVEEVAK